MPGNPRPASLPSSRATMNRVREFSLSVERFGAANAINLPQWGPDRRIASSSAAEATSNNRHRFGTTRFQVANRREYVVVRGDVIEVSLARTGGAAESA